jgi:hypothetical protein
MSCCGCTGIRERRTGRPGPACWSGSYRELSHDLRGNVTDAFRLSTEVIKDFVNIDPETQPRNVAAWTPVVTEVLRGCIGFEEAAVSRFLLWAARDMN